MRGIDMIVKWVGVFQERLSRHQCDLSLRPWRNRGDEATHFRVSRKNLGGRALTSAVRAPDRQKDQKNYALDTRSSRPYLSHQRPWQRGQLDPSVTAPDNNCRNTRRNAVDVQGIKTRRGAKGLEWRK
jgi:hypothetical protein